LSTNKYADEDNSRTVRPRSLLTSSRQ